MKPLEIARRRMRNSRLTGTGFAAPDEAVGWHLAMQAQEYGPAKWSIGQRSKGLADADVDEALADGSIVRTHVLRPTWHFVARDDIRWLLALSGPRVQQGNAGQVPRARSRRADPGTRREGDRLGPRGREPPDPQRDRARSSTTRASTARGQRMPYILMHCELEARDRQRRARGEAADVRAPRRAGPRRSAGSTGTMRWSSSCGATSTSHGPATVKDMSWWSGLTMTDLRKALEIARGRGAERDGRRARVLVDRVGAEPPPPPARGAHLLQTYDELVVGYTRVAVPRRPGAASWRAPRGATGRTRRGVFLLHGRVGGHWRRTIERNAIRGRGPPLRGADSAADARALEAAAARPRPLPRSPRDARDLAVPTAPSASGIVRAMRTDLSDRGPGRLPRRAGRRRAGDPPAGRERAALAGLARVARRRVPRLDRRRTT